MFDIKMSGDAVTFRVRVAPRASRDKILGLYAGALKVALSAPPVDGAANAALLKFLSKKLGLAKSKLSIVRGERGRDKLLRAHGVTAETVRALVVEP